jgi:hypothetical protein
MAATSIVLIAASSIMEAHFFVSQTDDLHQAAYYLAETGVNSAIAELTLITEQVHQECLSDFEWNPLIEPLQSLQGSAGSHAGNELGIKLKTRLSDLNYFTSFPVPVLPETNPQSKIEIQVRMPSAYSNPIVLQVISKARIGRINRRIDAYLNINRVGHVYDSIVFDMVSIAGGGVDVVENGSLRADGSLYSQGNILADGQSTLDILGKVCTKQTISIQNGSSAAFSGNLVCRSLSVSGSSGSNIVCLSDVYAYNTIEAHGPENMIDIKGKLYIAPDIVSPSAGVIAQDSGKIMLEDDIFIDGTLDCSDLVITEGQVTMKSSLQQPDLFFQKVLADMEKQASWNYRNQLIPSVSVPDCNVFPEGSSFTIENSDSPIVYILPDQEDINLPSGEYSGILMTDGSIRVNKGENVVFTGLLIAGGKLIVEGNLTVKEDKKLLLRLLDVQGEPLMSFFRISREKPLVEIQSCREHLYNEKIGG